MREWFDRNWKKVLAVVGVMLAVAVVVGIIVAIVRGNRAMVTVTVAPSTATVKIGDDTYAPTGVYEMWAGEYAVEISAEGFTTKTGKLKVMGGEATEVAAYLDPTAENADYYERNPQEGLIVGDIKSNRAATEFFDLKAKWKILDYVPYYTFKYGIDYEDGCAELEGGICVVIKAGFSYRDFAVGYLQNTGVELGEYVVKYDGDAGAFMPKGIVAGDEIVQWNGESGGIDELDGIRTSANNFVRAQVRSGWTGELLQIKQFGNYALVKVKAYPAGGDDEIYDTYRMVLVRGDGGWRAASELVVLLSYKRDGLVPAELIKQMNLI